MRPSQYGLIPLSWDGALLAPVSNYSTLPGATWVTPNGPICKRVGFLRRRASGPCH
jgi:hypothetical protein